MYLCTQNNVIMEKKMNYLDRNEFNFEPSEKVVAAIKSFDPKDLCFYTRIYDQGKKSVISVRLSEIYGVPEEQVLLTYGGEDMLQIGLFNFFLWMGLHRLVAPFAVLAIAVPTNFIIVRFVFKHLRGK